MTPERELYMRREAMLMRGLRAAQREANALVLGAEERGIVITIEEGALQPPAMGNTEMRVNVRISRAEQREMEALRLAAEKSEASE